MHESPSSAQLLAAVITFLNEVATPAQSGQAQSGQASSNHARFHARVSANALALVARELAQRDKADVRALTLYNALLGPLDEGQSNLATMEAALCEAIRMGKINMATPDLLQSLREVATAQLAIDQPNYSGLKT